MEISTASSSENRHAANGQHPEFTLAFNCFAETRRLRQISINCAVPPEPMRRIASCYGEDGPQPPSIVMDNLTNRLGRYGQTDEDEAVFRESASNDEATSVRAGSSNVRMTSSGRLRTSWQRRGKLAEAEAMFRDSRRVPSGPRIRRQPCCNAARIGKCWPPANQARKSSMKPRTVYSEIVATAPDP